MFDSMKQERLSSILSGVGAVNRMIAVKKDEEGLLGSVCEELSKIQGYEFAGIVRENKILTKD